jgi:hypothetical protein
MDRHALLTAVALASLLSVGCEESRPAYARVSRDAGRTAESREPDAASGLSGPSATPDEADEPGPTDEPMQPAEPDPVDAGADAATPRPNLILPQVEPAEHTPETRTTMQCAAVPGVTSFYAPPSLHVARDTAYVFSVDSSEAVPRVLLHATPLAELAFGEPTTFLHGARPVDLIAQGDELRALAGRQFYTVELASSDGMSFAEVQQVGPHEPTYNCEGYPPPHYFRGRDPVELIVVGSDYNTGVFGCYERVFVARREADAWAEPVEVGRGDAIFAFHGERRATIVTNLGVLQSALVGDGVDELSFETISGLDAVGGAHTGERLVLVRAGGDGVHALVSEDEGETWSRQTRVFGPAAYAATFIATDGPTLALASATATELVLSASFDHAATWSEPTRLALSSGQRLLAVAQREATTFWLTAGADEALELCGLR